MNAAPTMRIKAAHDNSCSKQNHVQSSESVEVSDNFNIIQVYQVYPNLASGFCNILKLLNITTANLIFVHKKETMEDFCFYSRIYKKKSFILEFFYSDVPKPFYGSLK